MQQNSFPAEKWVGIHSSPQFLMKRKAFSLWTSLSTAPHITGPAFGKYFNIWKKYISLELRIINEYVAIFLILIQFGFQKLGDFFNYLNYYYLPKSLILHSSLSLSVSDNHIPSLILTTSRHLLMQCLCPLLQGRLGASVSYVTTGSPVGGPRGRPRRPSRTPTWRDMNTPHWHGSSWKTNTFYRKQKTVLSFMMSQKARILLGLGLGPKSFPDKINIFS